MFVGARVCVRLLFYDVVLRVMSRFATTVKPVLSDHLKQTKQGLNGKWELNEGRQYCRMLPLEQSAILLICIKRLSVLKKRFLVFILSGRFR